MINFGEILRKVDTILYDHPRRRSTFTLSSEVYTGHDMQVERLDKNPRPVSSGDLHLLMTALVPPGTSQVIRAYTGRPPNLFGVTMLPQQNGPGAIPPAPSKTVADPTSQGQQPAQNHSAVQQMRNLSAASAQQK